MKTTSLAIAVIVSVISIKTQAANYTAHEWGTFTSVQGSDGVPLAWHTLDTAPLPGFVYDWSKPGYNRFTTRPVGNAQLKSSMITLQRMETPVIYFYSKEAMSADVSVEFPDGVITEWYPQTDRIGPARAIPSPLVARLDQAAHRVGVSPQFTVASLLTQHTATNSVISWSGVKILSMQPGDSSPALPMDKSGNHYFAARETDSNVLRVNDGSTTNGSLEHEKFLFYRGAGSFATALRVSMSNDGTVTLLNTTNELLKHLFVLRVNKIGAEFIHLDELRDGGKQSVTFLPGSRAKKDVVRELSSAMAAALTGEGLYPREAEAMVNTWKDSWFAEDGVRVLYILPRAWTDRTLPLQLNPAPRELVRVMIGRAEVLTPELESHLRDQLTKAKAGDKQAREQAVAEFKRLGRFAQPALVRAVTSDLSEIGWKLVQEAFPQPTPFVL